MKENLHITDDEALQTIRAMHYPDDIDVTDSVMAQVRKTPLLIPQRQRRQRFQRIATVVAACAVLAVAFNVTMLYTRNYNEAQIGSLIASVYDYHADYETNSQLIESAAFDYLYE